MLDFESLANINDIGDLDLTPYYAAVAAGVNLGVGKCYEQSFLVGYAYGQAQTILRIGRQKWGDPPAKLANAIGRLADADCLESMALALSTASSWEELLACSRD